MIENCPCSVKSVPTDEFSRVNPDQNLIDQALAQMWPYLAKSAVAKIWSYLAKSALAEIQSNLVNQVDLGPNLVTLSPTEIRSKVIKVHPMLKFGHVGPDKNSVKFYGVSPMDTSFKKFNLNLFYEKWILDFELDANI